MWTLKASGPRRVPKLRFTASKSGGSSVARETSKSARNASSVQAATRLPPPEGRTHGCAIRTRGLFIRFAPDANIAAKHSVSIKAKGQSFTARSINVVLARPSYNEPPSPRATSGILLSSPTDLAQAAQEFSGQPQPDPTCLALPVEFDRRSPVGVDILNLGVYDRVVPEAIYRLSDAGEIALDIGANIRQNASMMALV